MDERTVYLLLFLFVAFLLVGALVGGGVAYFSGMGWPAVWLYARSGAQAGYVLYFLGVFILILWPFVRRR